MSGRFHCPFSLSGLKELIGLEAIKCMYNAFNYPEYIHRIENLDVYSTTRVSVAFIGLVNTKKFTGTKNFSVGMV